MPFARSSLAGIATGAVLLAGVAGFGVGLPKVIDSPDAAAATVPSLPDKIGTMTALSAVTAEDAQAKTDEDRAGIDQLTVAAKENDANAIKLLKKQYGDAVVRAYVDVAQMRTAQQTGSVGQFTITVVPGEAGLVMPGGPYERESYKLQVIDGHKCSVAWSASPTGEPPTAAAYQVECRAEADGLTYDIYSLGMTPEDVAAALTTLVDEIDD